MFKSKCCMYIYLIYKFWKYLLCKALYTSSLKIVRKGGTDIDMGTGKDRLNLKFLCWKEQVEEVCEKWYKHFLKKIKCIFQ